MLATNCEFGVMEDRMLRSRIILGIRDKNLQQKLIAENPSYKKTVEICRTQEQGKQQFLEICEAAETAQDTAVNAVAKKGDACGSCGYRAHRGERCPATGRRCNKCGGLNHFARACKSAPPSRSFPHKKKELRELCADADDDFFSQTLTVSTLNTDHWTATVDIEGQPMPCKLDTEANCCVISRRDVAKLPDLPEQACRVALTSFFGHKATAQAKVRLRLSANERVVLETFYIIEQSVPVTLSGSAAERLEFIRRVQHIDVDQLYPPAPPFADVFTGLGELKDYEYEIKLKPGAVGVVVPARRIPVALEDKTRAELQRMEDQGVIRKRLMGRQTRTLLP
ncbi:uncharacterized protein LOC125758530 [Rhipicephalus sanguineus]|uniref:uncharacterized protein LOC125758530 n=1 Tax=Rhipicephalus sanguineus TaxID=34632 RepID=UPI0020C28A5A|nr:uncharacterized protein LOC125758530 [Rhipicephalus sanguineus]